MRKIGFHGPPSCTWVPVAVRHSDPHPSNQPLTHALSGANPETVTLNVPDRLIRADQLAESAQIRVRVMDGPISRQDGRVTRTIEDLFPPFGVTITCGPLSMRPLRESDAPGFEDAVRTHGIYDDGRVMPFLTPWADAGDRIGVNLLQQLLWSNWATFSPDQWQLPFRVEFEGRFVGVQDVFTRTPFLATRTLETGSWLLRPEQGRGTGTLMRQAVCAFAFDDLGAERMASGAFLGNERSLGVSRKVGYVPNGVHRLPQPDGEGWREELQLLLTPDAFVRPSDPVVCTGVDAFRRFIGLDTESDAPS